MWATLCDMVSVRLAGGRQEKHNTRRTPRGNSVENWRMRVEPRKKQGKAHSVSGDSSNAAHLRHTHTHSHGARIHHTAKVWAERLPQKYVFFPVAVTFCLFFLFLVRCSLSKFRLPDNIEKNQPLDSLDPRSFGPLDTPAAQPKTGEEEATSRISSARRRPHGFRMKAQGY